MRHRLRALPLCSILHRRRPSAGAVSSFWELPMNDAQRYRMNAPECLSAAERCEPAYRSLTLAIAASWLSLARQGQRWISFSRFGARPAPIPRQMRTGGPISWRQNGTRREAAGVARIAPLSPQGNSSRRSHRVRFGEPARALSSLPAFQPGRAMNGSQDVPKYEPEPSR